jgi:DNA/RNA-binding domain of Phe-tRNA-synthetase-like protein
MTYFRYHPDIFVRFPNLVGGVLYLDDLHNQPSPPELQQAFLEEQRRVLERVRDLSPSEIPSLAAWRSAFRAFGVEPTKYRSAAEALLRRLTKKGDIPIINAMVDLYNLISIRYALPMAAFDTHHIHAGVTVCFADGSERFTPHDTPEVEHPDPGEVIFVDEDGLIFARRWCWKQSAESEARLETSRAILTIEAHHADAERDVRAAIDDVLDLLPRYVGGAAHPEIYCSLGRLSVTTKLSST